jgi:Tfp pilus assembly protein PilV
MNAMSCPSITSMRESRAGVSLLEVLVACGILVIGLTSIAAILPAAGSRLTQASQADRGGTLAANAYAEMVNRGLIAADLFSSGTRACVFGRALQAVPTVSATAPSVSVSGSSVTAVPSAVLGTRINTTRGFVLEDDLVFAAGTAADTPTNQFVSGTTSIRAYNEGVCWGAMLACTGSAAAGIPATLSIAIFKKEPGPLAGLVLTGPAGTNMLQLMTSSTAGLLDEATRKQFLQPCSYVLAMTNPPQWLRVNASWTMPGPTVSGTENTQGRRSYVVLDRNPMTSGTTMPVVGFDQLLSVDQYSVTLD